MAISTAFLREQGLLARAMRSSAWTLFGFGAAQVVRLGSNLILTRLLYPEAFGLMTLVTVALVALALVAFLLFSSMGSDEPEGGDVEVVAPGTDAAAGTAGGSGNDASAGTDAEPGTASAPAGARALPPG